MIHPYELKANDVHTYTLKTLREHLNIKAAGYICNTEMILNVLIKASAENSSLEAACADLEETADSNTIREYLNEALPIQKLRGQERQANQALSKWLAFILILLDWKPDKVYQEYRRRFGIECSYRMLRRVRASTTSRNPSLRFFLLGVGLILVNVWVFLRWTFSRLMNRGPRQVDVPRFRLNRFSKFLIRTVEEIYGTISAVSTHTSPQSVIY